MTTRINIYVTDAETDERLAEYDIEEPTEELMNRTLSNLCEYVMASHENAEDLS